LSIRGAQTAISKLAEKVGIAGVSSHSFHRSALNTTHQAGLSLREVAEISGRQQHGDPGASPRSGCCPREGRVCKESAAGVMSAPENPPDALLLTPWLPDAFTYAGVEAEVAGCLLPLC
jgi:hypothetical protein